MDNKKKMTKIKKIKKIIAVDKHVPKKSENPKDIDKDPRAYNPRGKNQDILSFCIPHTQETKYNPDKLKGDQVCRGIFVLGKDPIKNEAHSYCGQI